MSGWISVKQRLPKMTERIERDRLSYSKDVIVWDRKRITTGSINAFDSQPAVWVDSDCDRNTNVTHWMPLPAPPTERKKA